MLKKQHGKNAIKPLIGPTRQASLNSSNIPNMCQQHVHATEHNVTDFSFGTVCDTSPVVHYVAPQSKLLTRDATVPWQDPVRGIYPPKLPEPGSKIYTEPATRFRPNPNLDTAARIPGQVGKEGI